MPKMKTNRSAAKRLRKTGSGRVRRAKASGSHILTNKSRKHKRRLRNNDMIDHDDMRKARRLVPYIQYQ